MSVEMASSSQVETRRDLRKGKGNKSERSASQWKQEIERAIKYQKDFVKRSDKIASRYRVEMDKSKGSASAERRRYNVLWSMVNTLQPNLFMGMPKPYVSRRYRDKDPIARTASQIIERCLIYVNDSDEMHDAMASSVDDYILAARGTVWTRYSPEFDLRLSENKTYIDRDDAEADIPDDAEISTDDKGEYYQESYEQVTNEECETDHIQLVNFIHPAASQWKQIPWVAKRVLMGRDELVERFGDYGKKVPVSYRADGVKADTKTTEPDEAEGIFLLAAVYEIWDRTSKKVYWICLECDKLLDVKDDPLKLKNFFPCPRPLFGTMTNNSLIPVPDFKYYESVAMELDDITLRISLLTESLRVVGFYDASLGDSLKRVMEETEENEMVPVNNWAQLSEAGGIKKAIEFLPIEQVMTVLAKLYEARAALVAELYEITGMSDIVRGTSDPRETASAQKIKGSYASKRLVRRQKAVARFAREHLEIQAEIICKHYSDESIAKISGAEQFVVDANGQFDQNAFAQALALIRDNPLRHFRIKIDNETLSGDEAQQNREEGVNFLTSISQLMGTVTPLAQTNPQLASVMKELVLFGVRLFPVARSVEGQIEAALEDLAKNIKPAPEQATPPPPPQMSAEQRFQLEMRKLDIQERQLGIARSKAATEDWAKRWEVAINAKRVGLDAGNRAEAVQSQERIADKTIAQKDRSDSIKAKLDVHKQAAELEQNDRHAAMNHERETLSSAADAERADREHEFEVESTAIDFAERRQDRDVTVRANESSDENAKTQAEIAREKVKSDAKKKPAPSAAK